MELRHYTVVFENAGADGWGAHVPDLPGCTAGGETFDDVVGAIQESINLWIEDAVASKESIPQPRTQALSLSVAV
jgi:predicted RNase H-like HicB family nuclease